MRSFKGRFALAGAISVGVLIPAWAMDTTMMKSGETLFVMPNGQMGSMVVTDQAMINALMAKAKPIEQCEMVMMGADGKAYVVNDRKMANGKPACETMMQK
jgi:hypothetical protein